MMKQDEAKKLKNLLTFVAKGVRCNMMKLDESQGLLIPTMKPLAEKAAVEAAEE